MGLGDNLQYKIENLSLYFQGGIRRSILIFTGVSIALLAPIYFLGQLSSNLWFNTSANPNKFDSSNIVNPKNLSEEPLIFSDTQIVRLIGGENTLYTTINNKANSEIGYWPFIYSIQSLDKDDKVIFQKRAQTYILPGQTKYIVLPNTTGEKLKIIREPETKAVSYNPNQIGIYREPKIVIKDQTVVKDEKSNTLKVKAIFKNDDQLYINLVDVLYIIRDSRQSVVGIGEYTFESFYPGTEKNIEIDYPMPLNRLATQPDIRWSINYLDNSTLKII